MNFRFRKLSNFASFITRTINEFKFCFANLFMAQIAASNVCICGAVYVLTIVSV